jgi:hypothetical protein
VKRHFLEITTVVPCPIKCELCPQEALRIAYHGVSQLSFEDFKQVLANTPKYVMLIFSGFREPFLNPSCIDMIEFANAQGYKVWLFSTLVGLKASDV